MHQQNFITARISVTLTGLKNHITTLRYINIPYKLQHFRIQTIKPSFLETTIVSYTGKVEQLHINHAYSQQVCRSKKMFCTIYSLRRTTEFMKKLYSVELQIYPTIFSAYPQLNLGPDNLNKYHNVQIYSGRIINNKKQFLKFTDIVHI